jgi:hypothetical protein
MNQVPLQYVQSSRTIIISEEIHILNCHINWSNIWTQFVKSLDYIQIKYEGEWETVLLQRIDM